MKLLLDVGNTRIKWAWLDGGVLRDAGATPHHGTGAASLVVALRASGHAAERVIVASVAQAAVNESLIEALGREFAVPVRLAVTEAAAAGVRNGYEDPAQLGVDRWLAMVAAFSRYRSAVCVVDAGTALTIDIVAADGAHQGGVIIPGIALMRDALIDRTGNTAWTANPSNPGMSAGDLLGRNTASCISRGARLAAIGIVEACQRAMCGAAGAGGTLVMTGGDGEALCAVLAVPAMLRPLLVLEGLAVRYGDAET